MGKTRTCVLWIALFLSLGSRVAHATLEDDATQDENGSILDRPDYDPNYRQYERAPSRWAAGFRVALNNIPIKSAVGNSYQFFADWVLPFQKLGLFSVGAHFGLFNLQSNDSDDLQLPAFNNNSLMGGLEFRYELLWATNQLIVPTAALEADYLRLSFGDAAETATAMTFSGDLGLMLNMGRIDKDTARDAYQTLKMTRAYLTLEWHPLSVSGTNIALNGNFYYLGVRLEFE